MITLFKNTLLIALLFLTSFNGLAQDRKAMFFIPSADFEVNFYIGGVGATINSETALAAKLSCDASDIKLFDVDSKNNVQCSINVDFDVLELAFSNNTALKYFIYKGNNLLDIEQRAFEGCTAVKIIYARSCTSLGGVSGLTRTLRANTVRQYSVFPKCTVLGLSSGSTSDQIWSSTGVSGQKIFVDPFLQTVNAGSPDGDLVAAASNYSAVITYVTDTVSVPGSVTDLSGTNITATTVDLTFSAPSSTNPILTYEVWVDGAFWQWISGSGGTVTGLTTGTNYNMQVITVDDQYNISVLSNVHNFTTS